MTTKITDSVMDLSNVQQNIVMNGNEVTGLPSTPTSGSNAASKDYVDSEISLASAAIVALAVPPGIGPLPWAGSTAPSGWLLCDGSSYLTATYPDLFAAIGYTYGGAGANFNVPDMRGRFPLGRNTSGSGINRVNRANSVTLGGVDGDETVALIQSELPAHSHSGSTSSNGSHSHTGSTSAAGNHTHQWSGDQFSNNGGGGSTFFVPQDGAAGSTVKNTTSNGSHSHTLVINAAGNHTHTFTTNPTGSNVAHENTPPFVTVNYIIKT